MTIIVAKKYSDKIVVAADKQTTWSRAGHHEGKTTDSNKIFLHNNSVFGVSGKALNSSLLFIFSKTRILKNVKEIDDIMAFLIEFYEWGKKKDKEIDTNKSQYIIVTEGKIFQSHGLDVDFVEEYGAIGSGMFLALGALECGVTAEKAVEVASKYSLTCSGGVDRIEIKLGNSEARPIIDERH